MDDHDDTPGRLVYLLGALLLFLGVTLMVLFPEVAEWLNSAGLWTLREVGW